MLTAIQSYLPQIAPLLIGIIALPFGIFFALRERAWRRAHREVENARAAA